jgi:hypothetical protein
MFLGATYWHYRWPEKNFFGLTNAPAAVYNVNEGWEVDQAEPKTEDTGLVGRREQDAGYRELLIQVSPPPTPRPLHPSSTPEETF